MAGLAQHHQVALLSFADSTQSVYDTPIPDLCYRVGTVVAPPARSILHRILTTTLSAQPDLARRLPSRRFQLELEGWLRDESFDVVQVEGLEMAHYALAVRERGLLHAGTALVFDDHNAEYVLQRRAFATDMRQPRRWPAAAYSLIQWIKLRRYERQVCDVADRVVAVSETDAEALRQLVPGLAPVVVPNGVDVEYFRPDFRGHDGGRPAPPGALPSDTVARYPARERSPSGQPAGISADLVFTGKMDFRPNVDAVVWFCGEILPRIRAVHPDVTVAIVGREPHRRVRALADPPGVVVTGYVDDIRPYIASAQVYVVPLRMGGGTRLKVLQAMAMGKAIVSTTVGAEGIVSQPGEHLVLADTAEDFASGVQSLLADPARREALGERARRLVERKYAWQAIVPRMDRIYASLQAT